MTPKSGQSQSSTRGGGRQGCGHNGGRGSSYFNQSTGVYKNNGAAPSNNNCTSLRPPSQICNRGGHFALDCYHRMDYAYQGRHPPTKLGAMATSNQFLGEQPWYTDTGAMDHITSDVGNLSLWSDYHGSKKVSVGNGAGLHISHNGSNSITTPSAKFFLNDMLCVLNISANLISVHYFANDNNCMFIFDSSGFCIKDKAMGKMLFRG